MVASDVDLALLALAGENPTEPGPPQSVVDLSEYLELGSDTLSDRISLLSTLTELEENGLVKRETADGTTVYSLTETGQTVASEQYENLLDRRIEVRNGTSEDITLAEANRFLPEPAVVRALARLVDGQTLYLTEEIDQEFVGRAEALAILEGHFRAAEEGTGRAVFVTGPSGVGKTALIEEFLDRCPDVHRLEGVFRSETSEPYGALRTAVEPIVDASVFTERARRPADADEFDLRRRELFADVANAVLERSADKPVVLFFDDLQHADPPAVALLTFLARRSREGPVFILTAAPEESIDSSHPAGGIPTAWRAHDHHDTMTLDTFDEETTAALIEVVMGTRRVPDQFTTAVYEHTRGNALFVAELVTELIEEGTVVPEHDIYPNDPVGVTASSRVEETIDQRLSGLDEDGLTVVHTAAILGEAFELEVAVLERACPLAPERVREYVDVHEASGSYDRAIASAQECLSIATDIGATALEADSQRRLGEIAYKQGRSDRAQTHFERSLALAREREDTIGESRALKGLGAVYFYKRDFERAQEYFARSLEMCREVGDRDLEQRCLNNLGINFAERAHYDEAIEQIEASRRLCREMGMESEVGIAQLNLGYIYWRQGAIDEAYETLQEGRRVAQTCGDERTESLCLGNLGELFRLRGEFGAAREYLEESIELADELDAGGVKADSLWNLARVAIQQDDFATAQTALERAEAILSDHPDPKQRANILLVRSRFTLGDDDVETAAEQANAALEQFDDIEQIHDRTDAQMRLGQIAAAAGDHDGARRHWRAALETYESIGASHDALRTVRVLVEHAENRGDTEGVHQWHKRATELLEAAPPGCVDVHREWVDKTRATLDP